MLSELMGRRRSSREMPRSRRQQAEARESFESLLDREREVRRQNRMRALSFADCRSYAEPAVWFAAVNSKVVAR